jgi:hypothetical protein
MKSLVELYLPSIIMVNLLSKNMTDTGIHNAIQPQDRRYYTIHST